MNKLYRTALVCGLIPLCISISLILACLLVKNSLLLILILTCLPHLYFGLPLCFIGGICLTISYKKARKRNIENLPKKTLQALFVLIINIPISIGISILFSSLVYTSTAVFENQSDIVIKDICLSSPKQSYKFGDVSPNKTVEKKYRFHTSMAVKYSFTRNGIKYEDRMFIFDAFYIGKKVKLTITKSGEIIIKRIPQTLDLIINKQNI